MNGFVKVNETHYMNRDRVDSIFIEKDTTVRKETYYKVILGLRNNCKITVHICDTIEEAEKKIKDITS